MTFKMPRNLMTAISVVAFAVLLNGCGGGGGSSPTATMDDDTIMAPDDTTMAPTTIMGADHSVWNYVDIAARPWTFKRAHIRAKMGQTITFRR